MKMENVRSPETFSKLNCFILDRLLIKCNGQLCVKLHIDEFRELLEFAISKESGLSNRTSKMIVSAALEDSYETVFQYASSDSLKLIPLNFVFRSITLAKRYSETVTQCILQCMEI